MHFWNTEATNPRRSNSRPGSTSGPAKTRQRGPLSLPALSIALLMLLASVWSSSALALPVPPGTYPFDANLPGAGFISYDGSIFSTPVTPPTSTMGMLINSGTQNYPLTSLSITGGGFSFLPNTLYAFDADNSSSVNNGDPIFGSIGSGSFSISDNVDLIISGVFASATFTSTVGATAASISTSDSNGLALTAGPSFVFDSTFVTAINNPVGFSISLSATNGAVNATYNGGTIFGQFYPIDLGSFGPSTGSTVVSGSAVVVPEPGTLALLSFGLLALATPAIRRLRRKSRR